MRKNSFGEDGNLWLEKRLSRLRFKKIMDSLTAVKPLEQIADFGSGFFGRTLEQIIKLYPGIKYAAGVDLRVAEQAASSKIKLIAADINQTLPLDGNSFDAVVSAAVIEHLPNPALMLAEAYRVLRPGGYLLLTTPAPRAKRLLEFLAFSLGWLDQVEMADHKNYLGADDLKRLLGRAGFKEVKIKTFQFGFNIFASCKK